MTDTAVAKAHARLSPSGAHRWMACPGSLKLEEPFPDTSSIYADEGTAAHTLMDWCLTSGQDASAYAGRLIQVGDDHVSVIDGEPVVLKPSRKFEVDEEMVEGIQGYCDYVRGLGGELLPEQQVDLSRYLEQPDCFGTADTLVIVDDTLHVVDLKYGRRFVDAEENKQLMLYGLGALDAVSLAYDIKRVVLTIFQPKVSMTPSTCEMSVEDLLHFAVTARVAAKVAVSQFEGQTPPVLVPGESQCQWCKAKAVCPALAKEVHGVATTAANVDDFDDLTEEKIVDGLAALDDAALDHAMDRVELVEMLARATRAEVERRLVGGTYGGDRYKLVEGKKGHRKWIDADEVELQLKTMRLKTEQMYDLKLISPTSAEKLAKAGDIGPRQWKKLQALYAQNEGKPSVAPEADGRPAISVAASADDFAVIEDGSDLV